MMFTSIRTRLITSIAALVTFTVGMSTMFIALLLFGHLEREHRANLANQARHEMLRLEQQLGMLLENTRRLTENHFIINGLIDPQGREDYLPKIAENFSSGREVRSFALVDFDGRPLYVKGDKPSDFNDSPELRQALSLGRVGLYLSHSDQSLLIVAPIHYYHTTQGAVVIQYDLEAMAKRLLAQNNPSYHAIVLEGKNRFIFHFKPGVDYLSEMVMADQSAPLLQQLQAGILVGTPLAEFRAPIYRAVGFFVLLGVILVVGAVGASMWLGSHIARPILALSDRVRRAGAEGETPCAPLGSNDELELLARAFDERTCDLTTIQKELEQRVKERTAELQRSEATLNRAQKVALLGSWQMDVASGNIYWSDEIYNLIGIPQGTPMDEQTFIQYIHPDDRSKVIHAWATALAGEAAYDIEHRVLVNDEIRWIRELAEFIRDDQGKVTEVIGTIQCITDRHQAEERIRFLSQAMEQSSSDIMITNADGVIIYVNPKCIESTGFSSAELLHNKPDMIRSGNTPSAVYRTMWDTLSQGGTWRGELQNKRKDGSLFWEYAVISPVRDSEGNITHYLAIKDDITEKKRLEMEREEALIKAEQASKAKSEFLANMSHEIRTPMNAIISLSHLCLQTKLTVKQKDYIRKVHTSATSLLGIINDILDFSKIDAGRLDLENIEFTLEEVLGNLSSMISLKAHEKRLEFILKPALDLPPVLVGDPLRLGQVLINLANNSVKFTETGEVSIATRILERNEQEVRVQFVIQDTGIGMTREQTERLFQAFSQADTSITRRFGGTGLGLAISQRLVALMGGNIQVESQPGVGSRFFFDVRLGIGQNIVAKPILPIGDLAGLKVLVVDDNENACDIMAFYLESLTFKVVKVRSGQEAVAAVEAAENAGDSFALVLMDYMMPVMDGITAATTIRFGLGLPSPPLIIMATAYGDEEVVRRASDEALIDALLIKPVSQSVLFESILEAFGKTDHHSQVPQHQEEHRQSFEKLSGARILLAEDNEINQQVARELLETANIAVVVVENGLQALNRVKQEPFDGVLMDVQMPFMDGLTATREIRKLSHLDALPIIAMTANAMSGDRELCLEAGMQDHVAKPVSPTNLYATLARWIKPASPQPLPLKPDEGEAPVSSLTDIPGLNVQAGLARLGGRQQSYLALLSRFRANQGGAVDAIRIAIRNGDGETAHRLAHTLKGVAATIGAETLAEKAGVLESLCKNGIDSDPDHRDDCLGTIETELNGLCQALLPFLQEKLTEPRIADSTPRESDSEVVAARNALIDQAIQQLENFDSEVEETLARIQQLPMPGPMAKHIESVVAKVSEYHYDAALEILRQSEESFANNIESP